MNPGQINDKIFMICSNLNYVECECAILLLSKIVYLQKAAYMIICSKSFKLYNFFKGAGGVFIKILSKFIVVSDRGE